MKIIKKYPEFVCTLIYVVISILKINPLFSQIIYTVAILLYTLYLEILDVAMLCKESIMPLWYCIKCGNHASSFGGGLNGKAPKPDANMCWKGGGHSWYPVDEKKMSPWKCSKCGIIQNNNRHPLLTPCSQGGNHAWKKSKGV
jgi:hypothetical protein